MTKIITNLICLCALTFFQSVYATDLYKWVDEDGNVSYQDTPPPKEGKLIEAKKVEKISGSANGTSALVLVYTVEDCETCDLTLNKLEEWGVTHEEKSLDDPEAQKTILEASGSLLAPTLIIGDKVITDISDKNLQRELTNAGYDVSSTQLQSTPSQSTDSQ